MCRSVQLNKENSRKKKNIEFRFTSFHYCARYIILHRPYIASIRNTKQSVTGSKLQRRHIAHLHRNFNLITRESWARAATRLFTWRCSFLLFCLGSSVSFSVFFFFFFPLQLRFVRSNLFHRDNFALWIIRWIAIRLERCTSASSPRSRPLRPFFRSGNIFRKLIGI